MSSSQLLTTAEVAEALGLSRQAVIDRAKHGTLPVAHKSPGRNGAYLFDRTVVESAPARYKRVAPPVTEA